MKYSDFVEVNEGFQTSINLEYDLNRIEKVKSYIPTEQSVKILGTFLRSFYYSKDSQSRARVLIGPYGRGKSHLLLVLTALTSLDVYVSADHAAEGKKVQQLLCDKIKSVDLEVGALAQAVVDDGIRTLPVVINSNSVDINQAFLIAIKEALERAGQEQLLPTTYFDAAIEVLDRWNESYPDVIKKFGKELKAYKLTIDKLYIGLKQFDQEAYSVFCTCYPLVTAGTEFNPFSNMDVVKLYMAVVDALVEQTSYSGINIIFDEFSKFLEANMDASKMLNFKIIQDMAEAATRSGKKQIHFTCITHKDILDYSASDSFKTVEGRFSKVHYIASSEQSYELIANAIPKKDGFLSYMAENKLAYTNALNSASIVNVFSELTASAFEKKVAKGCFPLAPLSAFALFRVSELVGQNERTLFTFLARPEEYSLYDFLQKDHAVLEFITIDSVYDYFRDLLKKEVFNAAVHSVWAKSDTALRQISKSDEARIIKAIAIINIIRDERFKTTPAHVKAALLMDDAAFDVAIKQLLQKHILSQRDSSELVMLTANGVDVQKNVLAYVNSKISKINVCELLENNFPLGYVIPREYNDRYSMLRYFRKFYMNAATFLSYKSGSSLTNDYKSDGVILYILVSNESERASVCEHIKLLTDAPEIIVCLSDIDFDFTDSLKKIVAIQYLKNSEYANDSHYFEEIQIYEEDLRKQIVSTVDSMYSPVSKHSRYINCTGSIDVYHQADLNLAVSKICMSCYCDTPVVNNEMVNKAVLNAQNIKGRNIVLDWMLNHANDSVIPCPEGYGPEVSIFKAMYLHTGLAASEEVADNGINAVLRLITAFVNSCEAKKNSFEQLYDTLQKPPYGMRKGIIPLFVVYVLRKYKENTIVYYKGKEIELSAQVLSALNDMPAEYSLMLEEGTQEKEDFLNVLETIFSEYLDGGSLSTNKVYSVAKGMQNWMRSLPEYTKRFMVSYSGGVVSPVDNSTKVIRNDLLKFEINAREMLFNTWRNKLSLSGSLDECVSEIRRVKKLLDMHTQYFRQELINHLVALFVPGYTGSLSKAMKLWFEKTPDGTKKHIFDSTANNLLMLADSWDSFDDQHLINELAVMFVSMAVEDWNDGLVKQFYSEIEAAIDRINSYVEKKTDSQGCTLAISLPDGIVEKSFSGAEISPLGKTALSNLHSIFDEYNGAIEPDEQLAIIAELIRDIVN